MTRTRTRLALIGIAGALVALMLVLGAACGGQEKDASNTLGFLDAESPQGAPPNEEDLSLAGGDGEEFLASNRVSGVLEEYAFDTDGASAAAPELQSVLDRKIIQSSSLDVEVDEGEVGRTFQDIIRIAQTNGGFVANSTFSNLDEQQIADLTIRVPGDRYQDVLARIRIMGTVTQESSDANDITEEFTDLQARLRTLEATERRYLELLGQAVTINDILLVQDRLDGVRGQIEQIQGRVNLLNQLTDLATITVHLRSVEAVAEPPADTGGMLDSVTTAWGQSLDALRGLATGLLVAAAFSWWLLPPLLVLGIGARWWLSRQPVAATETPAA